MKETGMKDCADWVFVLAFFLLGVILALAGIHMFNTRINRKTEARVLTIPGRSPSYRLPPPPRVRDSVGPGNAGPRSERSRWNG